ncbi:MAG: glycosyltransferase family 2 protein [Clostridium sp.]|jgi:glycosyltransferase involved in cell wall biosynthesis|uniref:glycosyltransferase family 2 protein n=1 Tax=Clostridium sp. TaxID=1506 RepID=UPI0025B8A3E7|nr:glycosyltransferase family 2 protein [Clostridium sp.]MCH3962860.1 glycosyltransferase family 2 protein [Clostridium sp.]MCI1715725.1 glycosyltransferase family 2 protein [Clostridium sp.]MCI1800070.1 glycosyltransferase family 2 protein [Clostridium sp.]MCI1813984.1 glycosyltransferase family 2 protein [Clostridium sp.]MCI1870882.1 glycosyltransferase family 2 protein [Clostridium sp.]
MIKHQDLTVSIVIPCRNEKNYIRKCLDSFVVQTYRKDLYEVLVCDGISDDGTRDIVERYKNLYSNIKLIDNKGLSAPRGMNEGIKSSKSDVIIIFGAHAYADEKFIEENIAALVSHEVGCVGGPIETINEDDKGYAISMAMSSPFGVGNALFRYAKEEVYVDTVAFGCYSREVLDHIGYFDEELVRNQDDELNFRLVKNHYKILLSPRIKSYYYSRSSLKKLWKQYYQYGFWKVRVMQKHGGIASIRHIVPAVFVITNILGIVLGIFYKWILYLWILEVILYLIGDVVFSLKLIKSNRKIWKYIFFIFPILHISYGVGFINGIFNFYIFKSKKTVQNNTKMSR